jgi:hypothetical protein
VHERRVAVASSRRERITERGLVAARRVADLVRSISDEEASRVVPGMSWSAADVAAHVVTLYGRALGDMRRSATPAETAVLNATCLAELGEIDMATLGDRIASDAATVWTAVLPSIPGDVPVPFHAGAVSTIEPLMGVMLLEMLVHGDDLARATDRTYEIDENDAWLCLESTSSLLSAFRRPDVASADDVVALVDERDPTCAIRFHERDTTIAVDVGPPADGDRTVVADPSALLLGLLGRRPASGALCDLVARYGPF